MNRYRLLSTATVVFVAALVVVAPAAPASAHTELKSTVPAAKSTTTKPVTEVKLTFTGLIKTSGTTIAVTGPDKTSYSAGVAQVLDKAITQKVNALPVGTVTVAWRIVAADGHPMQGSFTFTNKAAPPTPQVEPTPSPSGEPTTAPPTSAAAPSPTPAGQAGDDDSSSTLIWVVVAVVVLALVALGGLLWRRRPST